MKKIKHLFLTCILFIIPLFISATDYTISSVDEFNNLNLNAGDTVTWLNGTYSSDERITFSGNGTASNPIILKAETPGGVIFNNGLQMDIAGSYLIIEGFYWNGGYGASNFIQFRNGTTYAQNCTIQNCAINGLTAEPGDAAEAAAEGAIIKHRWIVLYGNNNNVLNCTFTNKNTAGALVLAEYEYNAAENRCNKVGHTIMNNYFYNYEKMDPTLSNSGDSETIRIGTSEYQNVNSAAIISGNYFVEADGENEIITNKSANNSYLNNTFRRCRGSLVMRHGANATVSGNYFLGENIEGTGGIRIADSDHTITNNYIQNCVTIDSFAAWNNGLTFVGGNTSSVSNCTSTSVSNAYQDVENITFSNNTFINTNSPFYFNDSRDGADNVYGTVANNLIYFDNNNQNTSNIISGAYSEIGNTLTFSGNIYNGTNLGETVSGFSSSNLTATNNGEIFNISGASGAGANISNVPINDSNVGISVGACFLNANGNNSSNCNGVVINTLTASSLNEFSNEGESQTITINSNIDWTASENSSWITIGTNSGSNNGSILVNVDPNSSTDNRTTTVTITGENITRTVIITQEGEDIVVTPGSCTAGTNLSVNATIATYSSQENTTNNAGNAIDGIDTNRWSANGFPQYIVVDLGSTYDINEINIVPYNDRAYQFTVEGSTTSSSNGFNTLTNATDNTSGGSLITKTFNTQTARYVKLTITGASVYTGTWASIIDFKIICAGETEIPSLAVSSPNNFSSNEETQTITVTSNVDWTVNENSDWITINTESGSNNGTIAITTSENTSISTRIANITITNGELTSTITVTQEGSEVSTTSCTEGTNLSLNGTIVDFSEEQNSSHTVANIIDGNDGNRWSAEYFPQYAVVDLGDEYAVNEINLVTYNNRDYQFTVEGSTNSASSGFSTLIDASNNTDKGTINRSFSTQTVRYVKLTITGANSYTGDWCSINDFEIICAGNTSSKSTTDKIFNNQTLVESLIYPNPFENEINISINNDKNNTYRLLDISGKEIRKETFNKTSTIKNLNELAKGIYFLQTLTENQNIINISKIIKK